MLEVLKEKLQSKREVSKCTEILFSKFCAVAASCRESPEKFIYG